MGNHGDGNFANVFTLGASTTPTVSSSDQGIASGDLDGDGRDELLITNFSGEATTLYASKGPKSFRERSSQAGISGPSLRMLGWGTGFADLDLDCDLDAFVFNVHVYPQADRPGTDTSYAQPDQLFLNDGGGRFTVEPLSSAPPRVSRASAFADIDGDGDIDLVALEMNGAVRVLRNRLARTAGEDGKSAPHWLAAGCAAAARTPMAIGARVHVEWAGGGTLGRGAHAGGFQARSRRDPRGARNVARAPRSLCAGRLARRSSVEDVDADRS